MTYLDRVLYWLQWLVNRDQEMNRVYTTATDDFNHAEFRGALWEPTGEGVVLYRTRTGALDLFEFRVLPDELGEWNVSPETTAESALYWFRRRYYSNDKYGLKDLYTIQWLFPITHVASAPCPACKDQIVNDDGAIAYHHSDTLGRMIVHLNDGWRWSREQIADWVDTLDIDLTLRREDAEAAKQRAFEEQFGRDLRSWGSIFGHQFGGQGSGLS